MLTDFYLKSLISLFLLSGFFRLDFSSPPYSPKVDGSNELYRRLGMSFASFGVSTTESDPSEVNFINSGGNLALSAKTGLSKLLSGTYIMLGLILGYPAFDGVSMFITKFFRLLFVRPPVLFLSLLLCKSF